jgi:hypothetical protein
MRLVPKRPLLPILLFLLSFTGGLGIAGSSALIKGSSPAPVAVGCVEDCKEKQDKHLEKCEQIPEARRENCREAANSVYNKCVERCGDRTR